MYFNHTLSLHSTLPRLSHLPTQPILVLFLLSLLPLKKKKNKNNTEKHGTYFVLANYSWAQGLPWSVVDVPNDTLLIFHF